MERRTRYYKFGGTAYQEVTTLVPVEGHYELHVLSVQNEMPADAEELSLQEYRDLKAADLALLKDAIFTPQGLSDAIQELMDDNG